MPKNISLEFHWETRTFSACDFVEIRLWTLFRENCCIRNKNSNSQSQNKDTDFFTVSVIDSQAETADMIHRSRRSKTYSVRTMKERRREIWKRYAKVGGRRREQRKEQVCSFYWCLKSRFRWIKVTKAWLKTAETVLLKRQLNLNNWILIHPCACGVMALSVRS